MNAKLLVSVVVLFAWLPRPLLAQGGPKTERLDQRVFIDVNQVQPIEVLRELSLVIGSYLNPDPLLSAAPVTLRVWNVRARTALDALCEMAGCRWRLEGQTLRVDAGDPPPPVPRSAGFLAKMKKPLQGSNWRFERVPLRTVAEALSQAVGEQVVFEGADLDTPITADLTGQPFLRAAFAVMAALGWEERGVGIEGVFAPDRPMVLRLHGGPTAPSVQVSTSPVRIIETDQPGLTMPAFASGAHPSYTPLAAAAGIQGVVVLSCVVTKDGATAEIKVLKSLDPGLDAEAVKVARAWRFTPGKKDGKPASLTVTLEVPFGPR
jgi:TonB family protein